MFSHSLCSVTIRNNVIQFNHYVVFLCECGTQNVNGTWNKMKMKDFNWINSVLMTFSISVDSNRIGLEGN